MSTYVPDELEKIQQECEEAGRAYSKCVYQELLFRARSEDFLAAIKFGIRDQHDSDAARETAARASKEWKDFREEQMKLLQEAGKRKIEYGEANRKWETVRSKMSMRKEEMKRI